MSESQERRSVLDHEQSRYQRSTRYRRKVAIQKRIEGCSKSLVDGGRDDYAAVARMLHEELLPLLAEHIGRPLEYYSSELADHESWDWVALTSFVENAHEIQQQLESGDSAPRTAIDSELQGFIDGDTEAKVKVQRALRSVVAISESEDIVMEDYQERVDAQGFSIKLGQQLKRADMDFGDPVGAITRKRGSLKHFMSGETGTGKTVAASRQFEDYYRAQFEGARRYKCLDYVGLGKAENIVADLPQQQDDLRKARVKDHDLPPSFEEIDGYEPELEVFIPLSDELNETELPYDTESEEFVAGPFTIPASDLSEGLLAALIDSQVSDSREQTIRDAYQVVDEEIDDWSLAELADEIRHRDELSHKHIKDSLRVLRSLQNSGFVRTEAHDLALDWGEVMRSTERVTAFSQSLLSSDFEQLMVVAYLLDKHWSLRKSINNYPTAAVWVRELWEIAQHQRQRAQRPDREKAVIEFIIDRLIKMMRKPRDIATHFVMDTQEPTDVEKAVRRRFNRYVIFDTNHDLVDDIMSWQGHTKKDAYDFLDTMSGHPGRGGIIGGCEPAIDAKRWGVSPVQFAPPSWHHHDKQTEDSAWTARPKYAENEVLRTPNWDGSIPEDLEVPIELPKEEEAAEAEKSEEERFRESIREEARHLAEQGHTYVEIAEQIPENPDTSENFTPQAISNWVTNS